MASRGSHLNEIIFHYEPEGLYFQIKKEVSENIEQFFLKHFPKKKRYLADPVVSKQMIKSPQQTLQ